ncbi:MAG: nucleotidyltransferase [Candidatus Melainabacteria bacterium]|jgi:nucleotidyltransferase substrate binding protein (TIGR01987 family)|nr:nucleotidyltransferase [Candidatus Melainabacteria bacterium]
MADHIIFGEINLSPLIKVKSQLDDALANIKDDLDRTGAIKLFEMCYELSWKTLKKVIEAQGLIVKANPREVYRIAADQELIDDPETWFNFHETRNLTVHTYNEETAKSIFDKLGEFQELLDQLTNKLKSL